MKNNTTDFTNKTFAIKTLGCKANFYDSECVRAAFISSNYIEKSFDETADAYIINTCSVTNVSEKKSQQMINRSLRKNPEAIICVMGCYSQINSDELVKQRIDYVFGTESKFKIVSEIEADNWLKQSKARNLVKQVLDLQKHEKNPIINRFLNKTRAFIKIQDGCNNFCTFCIIPYTRGSLRSRDHKDIIQEIKNCVANGVKEVVLTGIHTGGYGEDLERYNFADLLFDISNQVPDLARLRISSIEISQISEQLKNVLKSHSMFMPHFHIPVQAGCNKQLVDMERKYTIEQYQDIVSKLKLNFNNYAITTDIIIGFPNETEADFEEAFNFCKNMEYSEMHIFPYAPKKNTPAEKMPQVNDFLKKIRVHRMLDLNRELALKYINKHKDKALKVLFENQKKSNWYVGYSENYIRIRCYSTTNISGKILKVKISKPEYPISEGQILYEKS